jgi:hypothetical protein
MRSVAVGRVVGPEVRGGRGDGEAVFAELVGDGEVEGERVGRQRVQPESHGDGAVGDVGGPPVAPATQPVQGVALLGLVEWDDVLVAVPRVGAAVESVRPGDEWLPPRAGHHFVDAVAVEHRPAVDVVAAQPAADLDDDGALRAVPDLDLLTGGMHAGGPARWTARSNSREDGVGALPCVL